MNAVNDALIDSWRLSLHNHRPRTIVHYETEVRRFAAWAEKDGTGDLTAVQKRDIQRWIGGQQAAGLARNTIRNRWVCLRSFYGWALEENEIPENPVAQIAVDRPNPAPPDVLTDDEVTLLLKACEGPGFLERRDLAATRMLLATGLRVSELVGLHTAEVDLQTRLAHVADGKGGWARVVRFDPLTARAIDRYKRVRARQSNADSPMLWLSRQGTLGRQTMHHRLKYRSGLAGIRSVHPHLLRHTFAHRYLASGGLEGDLRNLGGWHDDASMRRYGAAQATDRALRAYDTVQPMGGL